MIPATFIASVGRFSELPDDNKPQVAFVGRSNVGKSSLVNHLANQKRLAHISREPGKTQTLNVYDFDDKFFLVDLPGYGYARTSKAQRENFSEMITEYLSTSEQLRMTFVVIDTRIPFSPLDEEMMEWLRQNNIPFTIIMNKIDKAAPKNLKELHQTFESQYPGINRIDHSVHLAKSRNLVWNAIMDAIAKRKEKIAPGPSTAEWQPTENDLT